MDKNFNNPRVKSEIRAISSKSEAHRFLICAALGDRECEMICPDSNADIDATAECLRSLGATVTRTDNGFRIKPIEKITKGCTLDCNESGSTLRFLIPLAASLGADCRFLMRGRLSERPLSPLSELLSDNGVSLSPQGSNPLEIKGKLTAGNYSLAANISSQFISGMLFALSVAEGNSTLTLEGEIESEPYIMMTLDALQDFGAEIDFDGERCFAIKGKQSLRSPCKLNVGGDFSNAAFFLVAGVIGKDPVTVSGLDYHSRQGDRKIIEILEKMGATIETVEQSVTVFPSKLRGVDICAADIPDLVPILAVAASVADGKTKIFGAARLRLKESDRIESVCNTLSTLGATITPTDDGMVIDGKPHLTGGSVDSYNDHRIAMSAAIAALVSEKEVKISHFEAINKSYPSFADNFIE